MIAVILGIAVALFLLTVLLVILVLAERDRNRFSDVDAALRDQAREHARRSRLEP